MWWLPCHQGWAPADVVPSVFPRCGGVSRACGKISAGNFPPTDPLEAPNGRALHAQVTFPGNVEWAQPNS